MGEFAHVERVMGDDGLLDTNGGHWVSCRPSTCAKIACSRGFVYMVNSWLMRDSLHWGLGRIAPRCLGSPPSPRMKGGPVLHLEHTRRGASAGPPPPELVSTREARGGYCDRSTRK